MTVNIPQRSRKHGAREHPHARFVGRQQRGNVSAVLGTRRPRIPHAFVEFFRTVYLFGTAAGRNARIAVCRDLGDVCYTGNVRPRDPMLMPPRADAAPQPCYLALFGVAQQLRGAPYKRASIHSLHLWSAHSSMCSGTATPWRARTRGRRRRARRPRAQTGTRGPLRLPSRAAHA
jgi:hypothetical protein